MNVRYRVTLDPSERGQLVALVQGGKGAFRRLKRAQILLAADTGSTDEEIARNVAVGTSTVYRTKQRFVEEGLDRALSELPRAGAQRKLGVVDESLLVAVACSKPPAGRACWTLQLLADEMVRLTVHDSVSTETIRRRLDELFFQNATPLHLLSAKRCARLYEELRTRPSARTGKPLAQGHRRRLGHKPDDRAGIRRMTGLDDFSSS